MSEASRVTVPRAETKPKSPDPKPRPAPAETIGETGFVGWRIVPPR